MMIDGKSSIVDFHRSGGVCYASFMIASILVVGPSDGDPALPKSSIGRAIPISESETAPSILHSTTTSSSTGTQCEPLI